MREINMQASGRVRDEDMVRVGQMLGADHLLLYELAFSSDKELEDLRINGGILSAMVFGKIIQIETGRVIYSESTTQNIQLKRPPRGWRWDNNLVTARNWALERAMWALGASLMMALDPARRAYMADGIFLDRRYGGPGILVSAVLQDGPGELAGIREGDVIIKVNGRSVKDRRELITAFTSDFTLTIRRGKEEKECVVHIERQ